LHKLGPDKDELYDLITDPAETKDLAAEKPEAVARMKPILDAWQDSVVRSLAGADYPASAGAVNTGAPAPVQPKKRPKADKAT